MSRLTWLIKTRVKEEQTEQLHILEEIADYKKGNFCGNCIALRKASYLKL